LEWQVGVLSKDAPLGHLMPKTCDDFGMSGIIDEVLYGPGVGVEVVEFFFWGVGKTELA
jgi:hypothetical protein